MYLEVHHSASFGVVVKDRVLNRAVTDMPVSEAQIQPYSVSPGGLEEKTSETEHLSLLVVTETVSSSCHHRRCSFAVQIEILTDIHLFESLVVESSLF